MGVDTKSWKFWGALGLAVVGLGAAGWQLFGSRGEPVRAASAGAQRGPRPGDVLTNGGGGGGFAPLNSDDLARQLGMTPEEFRKQLAEGKITFNASVGEAAKHMGTTPEELARSGGVIKSDKRIEDIARELGVTPEELKKAAAAGKPITIGMDGKAREALQGLGVSPEDVMQEAADEKAVPTWQTLKNDEDAQRIGAALEENIARESQPLLKDDPSPTNAAAKLGAAARGAIIARLRGGDSWTRFVTDAGGTPLTAPVGEAEAGLSVKGSSLDPNLVRAKTGVQSALRGLDAPPGGGGGGEGQPGKRAMVMTVMKRNVNGKDDTSSSDMRMPLGDEFPQAAAAKGARIEVVLPIQPPDLEAKPGSVRLGVVMAQVSPGVWQPAEIVLHVRDGAAAKQLMQKMRQQRKEGASK